MTSELFGTRPLFWSSIIDFEFQFIGNDTIYCYILWISSILLDHTNKIHSELNTSLPVNYSKRWYVNPDSYNNFSENFVDKGRNSSGFWLFVIREMPEQDGCLIQAVMTDVKAIVRKNNFDWLNFWTKMLIKARIKDLNPWNIMRQFSLEQPMKRLVTALKNS